MVVKSGSALADPHIYSVRIYSPNDQDNSMFEFAGDTRTYPCIS